MLPGATRGVGSPILRMVCRLLRPVGRAVVLSNRDEAVMTLTPTVSDDIRADACMCSWGLPVVFVVHALRGGDTDAGDEDESARGAATRALHMCW